MLALGAISGRESEVTFAGDAAALLAAVAAVGKVQGLVQQVQPLVRSRAWCRALCAHLQNHCIDKLQHGDMRGCTSHVAFAVSSPCLLLCAVCVQV